MGAHCLSGSGPCKEICAVCQKSYDDMVAAARRAALDDAIRTLTYYGFKVTSPAGKVVTSYLDAYE